MYSIIKILVLAILLIILMRCDSNRVYETNIPIVGQIWNIDSTKTYDFFIKNTKKPYNILTNIQYNNDFEYRNLYLTYILKDSIGTELSKELVNILLFTNKLGKPLGASAIGNMYEIRHPLIGKYKFPYKGKYQLTLQQYMRIDTLEGITKIGIRVESCQNNE